MKHSYSDVCYFARLAEICSKISNLCFICMLTGSFCSGSGALELGVVEGSSFPAGFEEFPALLAQGPLIVTD